MTLWHFAPGLLKSQAAQVASSTIADGYSNAKRTPKYIIFNVIIQSRDEKLWWKQCPTKYHVFFKCMIVRDNITGQIVTGFTKSALHPFVPKLLPEVCW